MPREDNSACANTDLLSLATQVGADANLGHPAPAFQALNTAARLSHLPGVAANHSAVDGQGKLAATPSRMVRQ